MNAVNDTLSKIKAQAERARTSHEEVKETSLEKAQRRHEAALPLLKAFADVQDNFVKIDVLKRIWPRDYDRRPDRVHGLVAAVLGGEAHPCGIMLHVPGGLCSFEVRESWDGNITYVSSRETNGSRPLLWQFDQPDPWLDGFYRTMAGLLEV
ncbi:hypothetical protein ThimaDRAFT_1761 [Thiocapsa marina 5811]|uniref:Uncharacterized protein n=1 Tax=Thiocapsa marina 5811 TaxID=768671 RepID=F9UA09_9GAMM|nr:hypothetical protein ThimaDRAFT_1761 [Thiocapsa marina 5811]